MGSAFVGSSRPASTIGGWSLIVATVLFAAVFGYLANRFDYPAILSQPAADVLPRLLALGTAGRAVWVVYGLIPFLLIPTAIGVSAATRDAAPRFAQAAVITGTLAAVCMAAGLLRWPSLHWQLAIAEASGFPNVRETVAVVFAAANSYLGTFIGEFLGELFLNAFFLIATLALVAAAGGARRWLLYAGVVATLLGALAMLRNATPIVAPVAAINNVMLPIWMLTLGAALLTFRGSPGR